MQIEFRSGGRRVVPDGRALAVLGAPDAADFRAMGCPEQMITKILERRTKAANRAQSADVTARAAEIGRQIEADSKRFAHVLAAEAPKPAPAAPSVVDADMQRRLRQASGRIHG